jgi:hypothetical protein
MRRAVVRVLALLLIPSAAWAQAQIAAPVPLDWVDKLIAMGPAGIMAVMWWLERSERVENTQKFTAAMIETKAALEALVELSRPQHQSRR